MQAYMNAPQRTSDDRRVELAPDGSLASAWRKRTEGALAGFYAALAISPRCTVTYAETQAIIAASESRMADVPVPPGAYVTAVERVLHTGEHEAHPFTQVGAALRLHVEDAAGEVVYVRVIYSLGPEAGA